MEKNALERLEMLNQLKLNDAQKEDVLSFFAKREAEISALDEIDTSKAEPMVHVTSTILALREDAIEKPFSRKELQKGAPTDGVYWCVPRVIE